MISDDAGVRLRLLVVSGVRAVAAVAADLDLKRRQVVQPALLHPVAAAFLLLLDHGAPDLLQRRIVFLLTLFYRRLLFLPVAPTPPAGVRPLRASGGSLVASAGAAAAVVAGGGTEAAPQGA